jgi:hypothetical protein
MRKKFLTLSLLPLFFLLSTVKTYAMCPVCTVAVAAGLGLSRYLGIDDTISGVWIGGLTVSLIGWTNSWLAKRQKWQFSGHELVISIIYFSLIPLPLFLMGIIGHVNNRIWGIDKLVAGMAGGGIIFLAATIVYELLKKKNNGRAHFPYEKIVFPIGALIIISLVFYLITK